VLMTLANLEHISGVSSETAHLLASKLANSSRPFVFIGYGFQRQWNGAMAVRLVASILSVIDQPDRFYFDRPYHGIDVDYIRLKGQEPSKETLSWTLLSKQLKGVTDCHVFGFECQSCKHASRSSTTRRNISKQQ